MRVAVMSVNQSYIVQFLEVLCSGIYSKSQVVYVCINVLGEQNESQELSPDEHNVLVLFVPLASFPSLSVTFYHYPFEYIADLNPFFYSASYLSMLTFLS